MPLPPLQRQSAESVLSKYCETKIPERVRSEIRLEYTIRGNSVVLIERTAPYREGDAEWSSCAIAKFTFDHSRHSWSLRWPDRNSKFYPFDPPVEAARLARLLEVVEEDATGIFWG